MGRYLFPGTYDDADCVLITINKSLIPFVAGALRIYEQRFVWESEDDFQRAYNAFVALEAQMSNNCFERLILEIRALRGGSFPAENWRDPTADPAAIGLSTIGGAIVETANVADKLTLANQKLDDIKAAIEANNADAEDILAALSQVAVLLG